MNLPLSVTLSSSGRDSVKNLLESENVPVDIREILRPVEGTGSLDLPELIKVLRWRCDQYAKENGSPEDEKLPSGFSLLKNSSLDLPSFPEPKKNPELEERLKRLAARQANKEYNKMVENISQTQDTGPKKQKRAPVIGGLNFAVTLFASCGATMYLLRYIIPDVAMRAGIGMAVGTVILVIEIFLAVREIEKQEKDLLSQ